MRILKYLFLLLLLSLVALSIYVATQKGSFTVERSKVINSPRHTVYSYVNDLRNWGEWNSLAVEDSLIAIHYTQKTIGNGSYCSWEGNQGDGNIETLITKEDTNITQKMNFSGNSANFIMNFKDTIGGTKITWKAKGEMSFLYKIQYVFNGGAEKIFGILIEKSLANLDKQLDYEINTFTIKQDGITDRPETFYLSQSFTSEFSKVIKNSEIVITKISKFCDKNNITISGKPFIIYHTIDEINKQTRISICIPIKDPIFLIEGSDISSRKLKAFQAVKTTLTGDYSHTNKAISKVKEYIKTNNLIVDPDFSHIEVFAIGKKDIKTPSKWTTEIYFPIASKPIAKPAVTIAKDTINRTEIPVTKAEPKIKNTPSAKITPAIKITPVKMKPVKIAPVTKTIPKVKTEATDKIKKEIPSEF